MFQLGFNVRGGAEHKCGVFISGVCKQHIINRLSSSLPYFKTILIQIAAVMLYVHAVECSLHVQVMPNSQAESLGLKVGDEVSIGKLSN